MLRCHNDQHRRTESRTESSDFRPGFVHNAHVLGPPIAFFRVIR